MKKIGIVTLSASDNCGSLLQAYALQQVLEQRYDCKVDILNLKTPQSDKIYEIFPHGFLKHPKKTFFTIKNYRSIKKQKNGYQSFRDRFLHLTNIEYHNEIELSKINGKYDVLISGSDQVWNIYMSDFSNAFFLPWKDSARKIAYAASLGSAKNIDTNTAIKIKEWINDFYSISVREISGKETLNKITSKEIFIAIDPTLLLNEKQWNYIIGDSYMHEKYIFYYSWSYPNFEMNQLVQKFAKKYNLPVYVINSSKWYKYRPEKFDFILAKESGPEIFLNLMKYAEYVFVQSFHGVVFSNLLHKRFFFLNENNDGTVDFRTKNIISLLDEESQIVHTEHDIETALKSNLTFSSQKLEDLINNSFEFLDRNIVYEQK